MTVGKARKAARASAPGRYENPAGAGAFAAFGACEASRQDDAGDGVIYAVSDRVTLDLGYRYYGTSFGAGCDCPEAAALQNQFIASEMLFAVRIYEPFRSLLR